MENNIIPLANGGLAIMNGGNPLGDCPKDWDEARSIESKFNAEKDEEDPKWKFDCGFKLDYDGDLVRISSRFYPPKTHYGDTWDGRVKVYFLDKLISAKEFDLPTIEELHNKVEEYVESIKADIHNLLIERFKE